MRLRRISLARHYREEWIFLLGAGIIIFLGLAHDAGAQEVSIIFLFLFIALRSPDTHL
jgi:hypothetical protein